ACAAQLLVPSLNGVSARRQVVQIETPAPACHRKIWMLENRNISPHPGVNVALHRDCDLFSSESFFRYGSGRLRLVPLAVIDGHRMDIVGSWIVVHHFQGRSEEHTSELQSRGDLVCRLLLEKKNNTISMLR